MLSDIFQNNDEDHEQDGYIHEYKRVTTVVFMTVKQLIEDKKRKKNSIYQSDKIT